MRKARKRVLIIFLIIGVPLFLPGADRASGQTVFQAYSSPQPAPEFSLEDLQGKRVDIRAFSGRVILLNFWATW